MGAPDRGRTWPDYGPNQGKRLIRLRVVFAPQQRPFPLILFSHRSPFLFHVARASRRSPRIERLVAAFGDVADRDADIAHTVLALRVCGG